MQDYLLNLSHTAPSAAEIDDIVTRNAQLSQALNCSGLGFAVANAREPSLPLSFVNPAFSKITGYGEQDVIGKPQTCLYGPQTDPVAVAQLRRAIDRLSDASAEIQLYRKDGSTFWAKLTMSPVFDSYGRVSHFVTIAADITDARQRADNVRQNQKLEALGTLAGGIAHDFNNMLVPMLGLTKLTLAMVKDHETACSNLQKVLDAGNRARDLVRQILSFSRSEQLQREPLALYPVMNEAVRMLRSILPSTLCIDTDFDPAVGVVMTDMVEIHQVVLNLCTNAAHAIGENMGTIRLRLSRIEADAATRTRHPVLESGAYACLEVSDNGCGMPPEILERMFDPFFTTKSVGEGTGLGLAVVHGIVSAQGGSIHCESTVGKGTWFEIMLPIWAGSESPTISPSQIMQDSRRAAMGVDVIGIKTEEG